jgi:hypothetical protein
MTERAHPYDLVFANEELEGTAFPAIRDEADVRGVDPGDREAVLLLEGMGELMRGLLLPDASAPAFAQFSAIVYHAYHYWLAGKQTTSIDEPTLRKMLQPATEIGSWDMVPPAPAGYVQLPRNLLFARVEEGAPAEGVDGFFYVMRGVNDPAVPPFPRLDVLLVLGLVPNRAGYSVVEVTTDVTAGVAGHFGDVQAREAGEDFENILPGGEGRLFAVTNEMEVLKLVSRVFHES